MEARQQQETQAQGPPELSLFLGDAGADSPGVEGPDLGELLDAWRSATDRLERTHSLLQGEVSRLTHELEVKNQELARKNRLADLGQMASHVAHEVRNSLVPVTLYLSLLRRNLAGDPAGLETLSKVEAGFTALDATVNDLLSFTAHRQPHWQSFLVYELVDEVCQSMAPQLEAQCVDVDLDVPPNTLLTADREMLRRAVLNLVINALDAMPSGGDLVITLTMVLRALSWRLPTVAPG